MSKFSIGFAPDDSTRFETRRTRVLAPARANANVRRRIPGFRGYVAILAFLTLVAALSMGMALWRLFHFAR
ncbi:MAG TPA: hypothetical protein PKA55_21145 [Rhodoblastus sp.]|nr:hypothetical protein [Rhodoblastus sp.]